MEIYYPTNSLFYHPKIIEHYEMIKSHFNDARKTKDINAMYIFAMQLIPEVKETKQKKDNKKCK